MAKFNKTALCVLLFSLLLIVTIGESRANLRHVKVKAAPVPDCIQVVGVKSGDTCFSIAQAFKLSTDEFDSINPNNNCKALFVGQWVCVDAV